MNQFTNNLTSGIVGFETNEAGHMTRGRINSVPVGGLDTTTLTYAAGCQIVDSSTGRFLTNIGTAATPFWIIGSSMAGLVEVLVTAAQVQLLFGGTTVQILPAPPQGAAQAWVMDGMVVEYVGVGGTAFTAGGSTVRAVYGSAGTNVAAQVSMGTATFFGTATKIFQADSSAPANGQTVVPGNAMFLDNTGAAFANGGTSSMKVSLWFSVLQVA